jgi:MFS family permease
LFGEISQHVGRKPVLLWSGILRVVAFPALFLAMANTTSLTMLTIYVLALTFLANGSYGPILIFLNERFPTEMRASGTGLSWNVGFALGGMMPTFVSLFATTPASLPMVLAIFTGLVSVLYVIGSLIIPETKGALERTQ